MQPAMLTERWFFNEGGMETLYKPLGTCLRPASMWLLAYQTHSVLFGFRESVSKSIQSLVKPKNLQASSLTFIYFPSPLTEQDFSSKPLMCERRWGEHLIPLPRCLLQEQSQLRRGIYWAESICLCFNHIWSTRCFTDLIVTYVCCESIMKGQSRWQRLAASHALGMVNFSEVEVMERDWTSVMKDENPADQLFAVGILVLPREIAPQLWQGMK